MHPGVIIIPAVALIFGPRLWVRHVLKRHNQEEIPGLGSASDVARSLLDSRNLKHVKVECTDLGDHYDPDARSVRISRDKYDRRSLTAVTTAAHEVGHAIQHASEYAPFVWRIHLARAARVAGEVGSVMLLSVPAAAMMSRNTVPAFVIGFSALGILGTGMAVQLVTLPTEYDASFNKALIMLKGGYIDTEQLSDARKILIACSLTYVASSLASVIQVWPWLPRSPMSIAGTRMPAASTGLVGVSRTECRDRISPARKARTKSSPRSSAGASVVRRVGKPLIRGWFRLFHAL